MLEEHAFNSEKGCLMGRSGLELASLAEVWFRPRQDSFLVSVTLPIEALRITTLTPGNPRSVPVSIILLATIPIGLPVGRADKLPSRQYKARVGSRRIQYTFAPITVTLFDQEHASGHQDRRFRFESIEVYTGCQS